MVYPWNTFGNKNSLTHDRIIKKGKKERKKYTGFQRLNAFPENSPQELSHSHCCSPAWATLWSSYAVLQDTRPPPGAWASLSPVSLDVPETRPLQNPPSSVEGSAYSGCGQRFRDERRSPTFAWTGGTGTWTYSGCKETWLHGLLYTFSGALKFVRCIYIT